MPNTKVPEDRLARTTDIATREDPSALAQLLADPDRLKDFPIETVERLFALDQKIRAETARREFAAAFNRVQLKMTPVVKRAKNKDIGSVYARAEDVTSMLDPLILAEGFSRSLTTEPSTVAEHIRFVIVVRHIEGHEERYGIDAPNDFAGPKGSLVKTKLHGMGSSFTYCERILLCKAFGVQLTTDDDGNAAAGLGPGSETISTEQLRDLEALMGEVKANQEKFLAIFGIKKFSELTKSQYTAAIRMLEAKR